MVAVLLGAVTAAEWIHFGGAHHHVRLAGDGIHIHQLAAIEIGQMLAVGRPGKRLGRLGNQRAVREDGFNRELLLRRLRGGGVRSKSEGNKNGGQKSSGSRQGNPPEAEGLESSPGECFEAVMETRRAWRKV